MEGIKKEPEPEINGWYKKRVGRFGGWDGADLRVNKLHRASGLHPAQKGNKAFPTRYLV